VGPELAEGEVVAEVPAVPAAAVEPEVPVEAPDTFPVDATPVVVAGAPEEAAADEAGPEEGAPEETAPDEDGEPEVADDALEDPVVADGCPVAALVPVVLDPPELDEPPVLPEQPTLSTTSRQCAKISDLEFPVIVGPSQGVLRRGYRLSSPRTRVLPKHSLMDDRRLRRRRSGANEPTYFLGSATGAATLSAPG
jgi:hypothetical protein